MNYIVNIKRIYFALLTFIFLSTNINAQSQPSIQLNGGIAFSNTTNPIALRSIHSKALTTWNVGIGFNIPLNDRLIFRTGLNYDQKGFVTKYRNLRWPSEVKTGIYVPDPTLQHELDIEYLETFIEIPFLVRYDFSSSKKFVVYVEAGIAGAYKLGDDNKKKIFKDIIQFVGLLSCGLNYTINPSIQLYGQPTLRYHITPIFKKNTQHLYSMGLELGIRNTISIGQNKENPTNNQSR